MAKKLEILDSTLRDGVQGADISLSSRDKQKIFEALAQLGVDYIEAGNPASNKKDAELFALLAGAKDHGKAVAFGSTCRVGQAPAADMGLKNLLAANTDMVCMFGKSALSHVAHVLGTTPAENLRMIRESIAYLVSQGRKVVFDAEHLFDGYFEDDTYAMEVLSAAQQGGAAVLCLCDTNGATYTEDVYAITKRVVNAFPTCKIGIHCHNDSGLAVASSMRAVDAGATHVQGTLLGIGERAGNANLATLIANLQLKQGYQCIPTEKLPLLTPICRKIADLANFSLPSSRPYVGHSAFAHKGGMHIDAMHKLPTSFEHINPEAVGNERQFLLSEVAGKSAIMELAHTFDPTLERNSPKAQEIIETLKELEYKGYQFEAAEQSFELVIRRALGLDTTYFTLEYFKTIGEQPLFGRLHPATAIVKVEVDGVHSLTAAEGNGPIHALDSALRSALMEFYPSLGEMWLADYKVRVLDSDATTAAVVRVLIESTDGTNTWHTVGVSTDILEASFLALSDSVEYKLYLDEKGAYYAQ